MTKEEMGKIMTILAVAYPKYYADQTKDERKQAVLLWYSMFQEYPADLVGQAVKAVIATAVFPPSIAEVNAMIGKLQNDCQEMTELEAWGYVSRAIRSSAYRAQEAWESLPAEIKRCVSADMLHAWAMVEDENVETVLQSNFIKTYRAAKIRQKQYDALPLSVKEFSKGLVEKKKMDMLPASENPFADG